MKTEGSKGRVSAETMKVTEALAKNYKLAVNYARTNSHLPERKDRNQLLADVNSTTLTWRLTFEQQVTRGNKRIN